MQRTATPKPLCPPVTALLVGLVASSGCAHGNSWRDWEAWGDQVLATTPGEASADYAEARRSGGPPTLEEKETAAAVRWIQDELRKVPQPTTAEAVAEAHRALTAIRKAAEDRAREASEAQAVPFRDVATAARERDKETLFAYWKQERERPSSGDPERLLRLDPVARFLAPAWPEGIAEVATLRKQVLADYGARLERAQGHPGAAWLWQRLLARAEGKPADTSPPPAEVLRAGQIQWTKRVASAAGCGEVEAALQRVRVSSEGGTQGELKLAVTCAVFEEPYVEQERYLVREGYMEKETSERCVDVSVNYSCGPYVNPLFDGSCTRWERRCTPLTTNKYIEPKWGYRDKRVPGYEARLVGTLLVSVSDQTVSVPLNLEASVAQTSGLGAATKALLEGKLVPLMEQQAGKAGQDFANAKLKRAAALADSDRIAAFDELAVALARHIATKGGVLDQKAPWILIPLAVEAGLPLEAWWALLTRDHADPFALPKTDLALERNIPSLKRPDPTELLVAGETVVVTSPIGMDKERLTWQRGAPTDASTWDEASAYCSRLKLEGQSGWRLPTWVDYTESPQALWWKLAGPRGEYWLGALHGRRWKQVVNREQRRANVIEPGTRDGRRIDPHDKARVRCVRER